jgi:hypothetical protein
MLLTRRSVGRKSVPKVGFDERRFLGRTFKSEPASETAMPSTLVHLSVGGLLGVGLLGAGFDRRAAAVVFVAAALPDLDSFVGPALPGAHRAVLHTLLVPGALAVAVAYDTRVRPTSRLRAAFGARGVRLAWVALVALVGGGIFPDLFTNGVNAFYPLHDAFYTIDGKLHLSSQRGVVQTFVDLSPDRPTRTTQNFHYSTGVDPSPGAEPKAVERVFPLASSGVELMLVTLSAFVVGVRLWENERSTVEQSGAGAEASGDGRERKEK